MEDRIDLKDGDLDRLLAGRAPADEAAADLADFVRDLRVSYLSGPGEATEARHLAAIVELARSLENDPTSGRVDWRVRTGAWQRLRSRRKPMFSNRLAARAAKAAAAAVCLVLATAGLALAGVDLPAPAAAAFEKLGLSLPNQAGGGGPATTLSNASDVQAIIDATAPKDRDCNFGQAVAAVARGSALPAKAQAACEHGKNSAGGPAARSHAQTGAGRQSGGGDSAGNTDPSAGRSFGKATSERAKTLDDATPEQRRQFGEDTADRAKQLGATPPALPTTPAPQGGPATGQTDSETGQSIGDQASGGRKH